MLSLDALLDKLDFRIPGGRWQLCEVRDQWIVPPFIKHDLDDNLVQRWTRRIPIVRHQSCADLVAELILELLDELESDHSEWSVIDFGSGSGGPIPPVEKLANQRREARGRKAIPFMMTDIDANLHLDAWIRHVAATKNLSFIPQNVDACNPTYAAISSTTSGDKEAARKEGLRPHSRKVLRLYCSSFHHFNDQTAIKALKSTLDTSDAFAIVELHERTVISLALVFLELLLLLATTIFLFRRDRVHLFFTYVIPLVPAAHLLDGIVGCLRCRTFQEMLLLVSSISSDVTPPVGTVAHIDNWEFRSQRILHTWAAGYMTVTSGRARRQHGDV